ncbi:RraA family protein [Cupriavidus plantarum]|uniref:Putative 4-hydroxy-4-methyl-2-oxoglutarate aldolase n=1 Tax=Cupriavidus plantarum TaxID=942865 RepID=A0A316EY92_9BURK|nr:methyltransferase [Cupriavidus plantarum]NYI00002.1 regulator of RNase E activity RraA [Cupriavidus plantarum]PWK37196.1 regulator of RNase E activity RraA [Cupriavidus plantarum]REF02067.1 regulator of RNase E activity RraA [Cupriavidus plantarum]RLK45086.1 regulator of RNase E activity RraA [Cupriavidus plantarum]CAG2129604.1 4-hydroxy-4-methyl-2-oxoglutarate aldolase/4-carboxy-4-hydroxy-2-oxoadipate aldolase [Cupriavidus plantarum]
MSTQAKASPAIRREYQRVSPELVERAAKFQAAILADVVGRRGTLNGRVQGLSRDMKVCGPALTVEVRPGDNLMFHVALAIAQPGDVIVVDGKGDQTAALCGEIMATQAQASGVAGFVIDAAVRDSHELAHGSFPVFSAGTNPCGPTKAIGGLVNWPASVAGVAVNPGDLIVGDADGVVVIPREDVPAILELAQKKVDAEAKRIAAIKAGELRPGWLDKELRAAGVLAEGETL